MNICITGRSSFKKHIESVAKHSNFDGRPAKVTSINSLKEVSKCQLLFIENSSEFSLADVLKAVSRKPILTISGTPGFGKKGVHLNFFKESNRIRFELNEIAAKRSNLTIGFRLKSVARLIGNGGKSNE